MRNFQAFSNEISALAISQVNERASRLLKSVADFKGNIGLGDHVHALLHLRHSVNQGILSSFSQVTLILELGFVTSNEKLGVYKPASDKEYKDLETTLQSLINSIDNLLLKVVNTRETLQQELKVREKTP